MSFCLADFENKEIREKLHVVTFSRLNKYPLTNFNSLSMKEKRIANEILNKYIKDLPGENWEDVLKKDFNQICLEEIFDNKKVDYTTTSFKQKSYEECEPIIETEQLKLLS
jgi:hypothetical protein